MSPLDSPISPDAVDQLRQVLGDRFSSAHAVRLLHGKDESSFAADPPDAVVFPRTTAEVSAIVQICAHHKIPMIPFGKGSSLEGHLLAVRGGISIDLGEMNKIIRVSEADLDATVEAGVTRTELNSHLRDTGLFFSVDPGADASLGGMAATGASGTNAVRYGTMRQNVLALKVVLPDGSVITTGHRARKSSAGYDLTRLMIGSEGTLGILTEVTVRLWGIPEHIATAACQFRNIADAILTVTETIQVGVPIARAEFIDPMAMRAINRRAHLSYPELFTLFFEFHGGPQAVGEQVEMVKAIAAQHDVQDFRWATATEERNKLWQARHEAFFASVQLRPGCRAITTDVCVPISRLAECIVATQADIASASMPITIVGHVGDGNFHLIILIDSDSAAERHEAEEINTRLVHRAQAMDGTCTGEHGIGLGKKEFLRRELGGSVDLMATIKASIDPFNLMNPGKIF